MAIPLIKTYNTLVERTRTFKQTMDLLDTLDRARPVSFIDIGACFLGSDLHSPQGYTGEAYDRAISPIKDTLFDWHRKNRISIRNIPIDKQHDKTKNVIHDYIATLALQTVLSIGYSSNYARTFIESSAHHREIVRLHYERDAPKFLLILPLGAFLDAAKSKKFRIKQHLAKDIFFGTPQTAFQIATNLSTLPDYSRYVPRRDNDQRPRGGKKIPVHSSCVIPVPIPTGA